MFKKYFFSLIQFCSLLFGFGSVLIAQELPELDQKGFKSLDLTFEQRRAISNLYSLLSASALQKEGKKDFSVKIIMGGKKNKVAIKNFSEAKKLLLQGALHSINGVFKGEDGREKANILLPFFVKRQQSFFGETSIDDEQIQLSLNAYADLYARNDALKWLQDIKIKQKNKVEKTLFYMNVEEIARIVEYQKDDLVPNFRNKLMSTSDTINAKNKNKKKMQKELVQEKTVQNSKKAWAWKKQKNAGWFFNSWVYVPSECSIQDESSALLKNEENIIPEESLTLLQKACLRGSEEKHILKTFFDIFDEKSFDKAQVELHKTVIINGLEHNAFDLYLAWLKQEENRKMREFKNHKASEVHLFVQYPVLKFFSLIGFKPLIAQDVVFEGWFAGKSIHTIGELQQAFSSSYKTLPEAYQLLYIDEKGQTYVHRYVNNVIKRDLAKQTHKETLDAFYAKQHTFIQNLMVKTLFERLRFENKQEKLRNFFENYQNNQSLTAEQVLRRKVEQRISKEFRSGLDMIASED